jgi:membrane carboxypeptidase/penicillin-binding protein
MRGLVRLLVIGIGVIVLAASVGIVWVFLYSRDLPNMKAMAQFAPAQAMNVSDPCLTTATVAIPNEAIGSNLRAALSAVEAGENDQTIFTQMYRGLTDQAELPRVTLSLQISRSMSCVPSKTLNRELREMRTAVQLERRFSRRELFTIFANRVWFGDGQVGVQAASQHFFQKEPSQLSVADAALLAGLVRAPSHFSPLAHPDRALQRRNEVIDAMVAAHAIPEVEGEVAKASVLGVVTR